MEKPNFANLHANIGPVLEIALLGNHTVTFACDKQMLYDFGMEKLRLERNLIAEPIGYSRNLISTRITADIVVELSRFTIEDYQAVKSGRRESFEEMQNRIKSASPMPEGGFEIASPTAYWALLKTAKERLNLSLSDLISIESVAQTIARLDKAAKVQTEHIAEAIQYKSANIHEIVIIE